MSNKPQQDSQSHEVITYTPLAESTPIELSLAMIYKFIATPTKSGQKPTEADCLHFRNLCVAQQLNPWTKDCWMLGYDTKDGPKFEIITAYQSILKRADANEAYDGMRGGLVVVASGGEIVEREGALTAPGDKVIGGWAVVRRRDRTEETRCRVKLETYSTGQSRWNKDPDGMIVKVAKSQALREAFPNTHSGLYSAEEMAAVHSTTQPAIETAQRVEFEQAQQQPAPEAAETTTSDFERIKAMALKMQPGDSDAAEKIIAEQGIAMQEGTITADEMKEIGKLVDAAMEAAAK